MILKFWPRWPRKWPLNLSSLGGRPLDFDLNGIFEISGFHWSKWAIACLIWRTFIFQIFSLQPPRLLTNLKNESALCKWPINQFKIKKYKQAYCPNVHIYIVNRYTTVKPLWCNLGLLETTTLKGFTTKIALPPFHVRKFYSYIKTQ